MHEIDQYVGYYLNTAQFNGLCFDFPDREHLYRRIEPQFTLSKIQAHKDHD